MDAHSDDMLTHTLDELEIIDHNDPRYREVPRYEAILEAMRAELIDDICENEDSECAGTLVSPITSMHLSFLKALDDPEVNYTHWFFRYMGMLGAFDDDDVVAYMCNCADYAMEKNFNLQFVKTDKTRVVNRGPRFFFKQ